VVEIDGPNHTRPPSLVADDSRDRLQAETGVTVLRFTEFEIERQPDAVAAALYPRL
jgi:very-short-patch-repair endonuclease